MNALAPLLCSLALAADPPPAALPVAPPAIAAPPVTAAPSDWDEATPAEAPPAAATSGLRGLGLNSAGVEVMAPRTRRGRRFEQPVTVVFDAEHQLDGPFQRGLHGGIGYAQLDRTDACGLELSFCRPLLSVVLGGLLRATTPPRRAVVGWIAVGAGIDAALNWELDVLGAYARADAGVDLRLGRQRFRLAVGWVAAAFTENRREYEPGPQRYLAFTLMVLSP